MKSKRSFILVWVMIGVLIAGCSVFNPQSGPARREVKDNSSLNPSQNSTSPRKRLGVLPFLDFGKRPETLKNESQIRFIEEMNRQGTALAFLVDRTELSSCPVLNEEYDMKACARDSQKLGYQALVEGKILDFKVKRAADPVGLIRKVKTTFEAVLRIRVYSLRGQKEIFNTDKTVTYSEEISRIGERATSDQVMENYPELTQKIIVEGFLEFIPQIEKILGRMNWEGRIAAVQGQKIYLNVGSLSGVHVGDLLRVYEEGTEVYDPEMGTAIGKAPGAVKGTLEVVSFFGQDGSISIIHSGGGFKENDRVELY